MLKTQINDRKPKQNCDPNRLRRGGHITDRSGGSTLTGLLDFHFTTFNEILQLFTRVFLFLFLLWRLTKARFTFPYGLTLQTDSGRGEEI